MKRILVTGGAGYIGSHEDAVDGMAELESDYHRHCKAAREIAEEYFDMKLLEDGMSAI